MQRFLVLTGFLLFRLVLGQEVPPVKDFPPRDYSADNQNWSISQDDLGFVYIANNAGLLTYDGAEWKLYPTPNSSVMRSVKAIGERIYVGFYMEFGYYQKNEVGNLEYTSLSSIIQENILEDEQFWQIEHYKNWILFRSLNRVYLYNVSTNSFEHHTAKNIINHLSVFDDGIYYHVSNEGIYTIEEGKEKLFVDNAMVKTSKIVNLFPHPEGLIAVTDKDGIYIVSQNATKPLFNNGLNETLRNNSIYTSLKLSNNQLAIGTISNGLLILDADGNIENHLNQEKGLTNNTIHTMYEDRNKNLWLGTNHGINYVNTNASIKIYYDRKGELGTVNDAIKYKGTLYLGTNQGLFYMPNTNSGHYQMIPGTSGAVWSLFEYDGTLFCGHDSGTFIVKENKAAKIANIPGSWLFKKVNGNPDILLQGNYKGIHVLHKQKGTWAYKNKIKGFDNSSRFFEIMGNTILVNHEYKGVYELEVDKDLTRFTSVNKLDSFKKNQGSAIASYKNNIHYASKQGFYTYNKNKMAFERNDSVSKFISHDFISGVMSVNDHGLWMFAKKALINLKQGQLSQELEIKRIPFPITLSSSMIVGFENLTKIDDGNYLIGFSNGYALVDVSNPEQDEFGLLISQINNYDSKGNLSTQLALSNEPILEHNNNGFQFSYAAPYFSAIHPVLYQTRLLGRSTDWSGWSNKHSISYDNLPSGDYVFEVRAKAGETFSKNVARYSFSIDKPWYASHLAYAIYALAFLSIAYLVHSTYQRYFRQQKQRLLEKSKRELALQELQANQTISNIEKEQLQKDIENKSRELGIATMSIIKKNEFLNSLKKTLREESANPNLIARTVKKIDKNLTDTDDWKFFEEAFNNADKGFLKKIKTIHPDLTPNDLRLCAYLRLNLSSKEIAPLLNMSPRSVETKRYRLRKKMLLEHKQSLVEHILNL